MQSKNLMSKETSPYLLQHKDNPVHWHPWNSDTLKLAQQEDKLILLSIGYAACHWCHVMAHECFEDNDVAKIMNDHFISIKVDREERPDIDQIYMKALVEMGQQGGWPLTMFVNPQGRPIWGGTYFPKNDYHGQPGFMSILHHFAKLYRENPKQFYENDDKFLTHLQAQPENNFKISPQMVERIVDKICTEAMDLEHGGRKGAPKFPEFPVLKFLWQASYSLPSIPIKKIVLLTLERICQGGIYDHLGGGLSRYSVDDQWLVPHFEKMLCDNAQFFDLLLNAFKYTGNELFKERIEETLSWLIEEMLTKEGGFSASLDADSEGEEGKYYVWQESEIDRLLENKQLNEFKKIYDIHPHGNWEGKNILNRLNSFGPESDKISRNLSTERSILRKVRKNRIPPGLDDKILTDWNGYTIAALARLSVAGIDPELTKKLAVNAFNFINKKMKKDEKFGHSWRKDKLIYPGNLGDFSAMVHAALALYELDFDQKYIAEAEAIIKQTEQNFHDEKNGGFYFTMYEADDLIFRPKSGLDDSTPNPNGLLATDLLRLYMLTGNTKYKTLHDEIINAFNVYIPIYLFNCVTLVNAFNFAENAISIVIVGPKSKKRDELLTIVRSIPNPNFVIFAIADTAELPDMHPAKNKEFEQNTPTVYICPQQRCLLPIVDPQKLKDALANLNTQT